MNRSHRFLARALAAFLIVIQGLAGGAIAVAHSEQGPTSATVVVTGDDAGSALHGDVLCPLCLLAGSHAQQTAGTYVTAIAAIPSQPQTSSDVTPRATLRPLTSASPRAPPAILALA
jgi:uncharacterized protein CbrC (UPF0167 family)